MPWDFMAQLQTLSPGSQPLTFGDYYSCVEYGETEPWISGRTYCQVINHALRSCILTDAY